MTVRVPKHVLSLGLISFFCLLYVGLRAHPLTPYPLPEPNEALHFAEPDAFFTDAIMLFGDSITEASFAGSFSHRMSEAYVRKLDVINRGFGGYNSDWAIPTFKQVWATKAARDAGRAQKVKLLTIWFGANDAKEPGSPFHVPLPKYKENIETIVSMVRSPSSPYYAPETKIILMTPPPVIYEQMPSLRRGDVAKYASAVKEVGREAGIPVLDTFAKIISTAGGDTMDKLLPYFRDGIHPTAAGYHAHFEALMEIIAVHYPELDPEKIELRMPFYQDLFPPADALTLIEEAGERRRRGEL